MAPRARVALYLPFALGEQGSTQIAALGENPYVFPLTLPLVAVPFPSA